MKTSERKQVEERAKKNALVFVLSGNYAKQQRYSRMRKYGDSRTIYGKAYNKAIDEYSKKYAVESAKAYEKHCRRAIEHAYEPKQMFINVKENSMWKDYKANKMYITTTVFADHIRFGCRNHWTNNAQDTRVLKAIMKANA